MKLTTQRTIGNKKYNFEFEGTDLHECLMESQKISFYDLMKCGLCESPYLKLIAYITKEPEKYKYVKVFCEACKAGLTLGQQKSTNAYYFRKNKDTDSLDWVKYEKPQEEPNV